MILTGWGWVQTTLLAIYLLAVLVAVTGIISEKRDPVKSLAWIAMIALVPVLGMVVYLLFGRNWRKRKMFSRKGILDEEWIENVSRRQFSSLSDPALSDPAITDPAIAATPEIENNRDTIRLMLGNSRALLALHNRVEVLQNGKATFSSLYEALKGATRSIHLEYYIFENDRIGRQVEKILTKKARAGVEVRLIYDGVGTLWTEGSIFRRLRRAGVRVECFMPVVFPWLTSRVNYRNHRKIAVIDGRVAYTGGINVAERYLVGTRRLGKWRDIHLRIEGEAVNLLQSVFITDWHFVCPSELLRPDDYFGKSSVAEVCPMQIAVSGPDSDWSAIMQAFFSAIMKARERIFISTPYFTPNAALLTAMKVAALSGIDVRLLIPGRSDSKVAWWATRSYVQELLEAGIKVYMFQGGFNHSKLVIIDGDFCSVGSANIDMRSFEDNFEVSALIYDRAVAARLEAGYEADLRNSRLVTLDEWASRSNWVGGVESLARLLSPLL
ncbi:MAG: cardiolipin synthase [Alistipes sp.]|jgi:cardiolipin synthase|nr:cardiolipin synthase [Alistipes sp.]